MRHFHWLAATTLLCASAAHADDYIRLADDTDKCMHKENGNFDNGNPMHLWDCDAGSDGNKTFIYDADTGYIHFREDTSKCIHKKYGNFDNGNPLHLWSCSAGNDNNKTWTYDAATGYIHARQDTSMCIHKQYGNTDNGNPLHLWACSAGKDKNKSWVITLEEDEEPFDEIGSTADTGTAVSTLQNDIWSEWIDRDNAEGSGDWESVSSAYANGLIECDDPIAVQARRKSDGLFAEYTGEVITLNTTSGFFCRNADQPDGACDDYEARYACPLWSSWISRDTAADTGDYEGIASHYESGDFACDTADTFEARRISDGVDAAATGETVTYDTSYGFACINAEQGDGQCDDYEVRMRCVASQDAVESYAVGMVDSTFTPAGLSGLAMDGIWLAELEDSPINLDMTARMDPSGRVAVESSTSSAFAPVSVVAFAGDLIAQGIAGEMGTVVVDDGGIQISLDNPYNNPVVFAQVVTQNEADPVMVSTSIINNTWFPTLALELSESADYDGSHGDETVHYVVIEAGDYFLDGYRTVQVGFAEVDVDDGDTQIVTLDDINPANTDEMSVVVTRGQGVAGWHSTRSLPIHSGDGELVGLGVRFNLDPGVELTTLGYLIVGGEYATVDYDESVEDACGAGGNAQNELISDSGTYGNSTVGATHYFNAGITQDNGSMWAGAEADVSAKLFGTTQTIFAFEASGYQDGNDVGSRVFVEVANATIIDESIGVNYDWSSSQTFFEASANFYGVTVSAELVGTIGIEASAALGGNGITIGGMPYADVTASASAGVGGWCLSAGVGADLSVIAVEVPVDATLALVGNDVAWSVDSSVEMESLSGSIYLYVDYCLSSDDYKIFKWKGIEIPTIELIDASGCF